MNVYIYVRLEHLLSYSNAVAAELRDAGWLEQLIEAELLGSSLSYFNINILCREQYECWKI